MKLSAKHEDMVGTIAGNCLAFRLRMLNRMAGAIYDEAMRPHGIKGTQVNILVAVAFTGRATSRELCRVLHMDASTFSRALARLKKKGWLAVSQSGEGKILNVEITGEGLEKIEQVYPDWRKAQARVEEALGEAAAEMLIASSNRHLFGELNR